MAGWCKWFLDMGLKNIGGFGFSRIVQTGSVLLAAKKRGELKAKGGIGKE